MWNISNTWAALKQRMQNVNVKLNTVLPWQKKSIQQEEGSFQLQIGFQFKEETAEILHLEQIALYGAEIWHFRK